MNSKWFSIICLIIAVILTLAVAFFGISMWNLAPAAVFLLCAAGTTSKYIGGPNG